MEGAIRVMRKYRLLKGLKVATVVAIGIVVFGFVVERLWNWLVPAVFGWRSITFVQALGLLVLSKILFGGFHRHGGGRRWKRGLDERWANMSAEDRERFRAGLCETHACRWDGARTPGKEEATR